MNAIPTDFQGLYVLEYARHEDERGSFNKIFQVHELQALGIDLIPREVFFSDSNKDVLRGMHFQMPPHDMHKIVTVQRGKVLDVVLDLRSSQPTFGRHFSIVLDETVPKALVIPKGMAHGYLVQSKKATVLYVTSAPHQPNYDTGILWNSFGCDWGMDKPVLSPRDQVLKAWESFESQF